MMPAQVIKLNKEIKKSDPKLAPKTDRFGTGLFFKFPQMNAQAQKEKCLGQL